MKLSDRAGNLPQQTFPLLPDIHTKVFTEGIHQKCQTKDVHTKRSAFGTPIPHTTKSAKFRFSSKKIALFNFLLPCAVIPRNAETQQGRSEKSIFISFRKRNTACLSQNRPLLGFPLCIVVILPLPLLAKCE